MIERNFYKDRKAKLYHHNEEEIHLKSYLFGNGIRLVSVLAGITCLALLFENSRMDNTSIVVLYVLAAILTARFTEGYIFGTGGEGFERFNLAIPRSVLEDACQRLLKAFGK